MKNLEAPAIGIALTVLVVITFYIVSGKPPVIATPRLLDCDPAFFAGKEVRVKTTGCEIIGSTLAYRKTSDSPPCVVLVFRSGRAPDPVPEFVTGLVGKRGANGTTYVTDCR